MRTVIFFRSQYLLLHRVKALNGTPLSHLQVSYIHEARGVRELLEAVLPTSLPAGMNEIIGNFADEVKKSLVGKLDINSLAQRLACKAANVPGEDSDYISYSENPPQKKLRSFLMLNRLVAIRNTLNF